MDERMKVCVSAFFHDIGKFWQRGMPGSNEKHTVYSRNFAANLFNDELISNLVFYQAKDDIQNSSLTEREKYLAEIVCEADSLAAGERSAALTVTQQQPMESIFSNIAIGNAHPELYFQGITDLHNESFTFPKIPIDAEFLQEKLANAYGEHCDNFNKEMLDAKGEHIETLFAVAKKYLWCIPSSSYKTRSDVSLYEHSKITAALAVCLYDFLEEAKDNGSKPSIEEKNENRYMLILADITGIQKYIYSVGHAGALKSLKGRSFYLQQMLDNIAYWMLDKKLGLPVTNLIYSSGGKFYLIVPNTKKTQEAFKEIQSGLDKHFLQEYNGALGIVLAKEELSGKHFEYNAKDQTHAISAVWDEINRSLDENKKRKFSSASVWKKELFMPHGLGGDLITCCVTGKELIESSNLLRCKTAETSIGEAAFIKHSFLPENTANEVPCVFYQNAETDAEGKFVPEDTFISQEQFSSQSIGNLLKKSEVFLKINDQLRGFPVLSLNSFELPEDNAQTKKNAFHFANPYTKNSAETGDAGADSSFTRSFVMQGLNFLQLPGKNPKGFKFYGGSWQIPEFGALLEKGVGIERLGVLRMDVDNLGNTFKEGFGSKATFGRIVQLSSLLEYFFAHYINKLAQLYWDPQKGIVEAKTKFPVKDLMQIVYSGGDDVFIVGHWCVLPDAAAQINEWFGAFTCNNPAFSLSAGISLFDNKYPLFKAALEAGEMESAAKSKTRNERNTNGKASAVKNGICFLADETPMSWEDFAFVHKTVRKLFSWIEVGKDEGGEKKKIGKSFISRLYSLYNEFAEGEYKNWSKWRWRAAYSLSRVGKQYKTFEKEISEFATELFTGTSTKQELVSLLYIIAQWTDYLTRKKEID